MTTEQPRPPRDWTPRAVGDAYCSPACGAGCKSAAHNRAQDEAAALAARLGPAWRPVVWENMDWHWKAERGGAKVHPSTRGSTYLGEYEVVGFTCYLSPHDSPGGTWVGKGDTPQQALADAMRQAIADRDQINVMLEALRDE